MPTPPCSRKFHSNLHSNLPQKPLETKAAYAFVAFRQTYQFVRFTMNTVKFHTIFNNAIKT